MAFKIIPATEAKTGATIIVDNAPCIVRTMDVSKTGKHGHAKCRIEAINILDGKKKVVAVPGHDRLEVPLVEKRKGQVLSTGDHISVMDLESFETMDVQIFEELLGEITPESQVEYWDIEGTKIIKRKF